MYSVIDDTKKVIYGYHNKKSNRYSLVKKGYPLIVENDFEPFFLTTDHIFTSSINDIKGIVRGYEKFKVYQDIKNKIANIIVIPGLLVATIYILKIFDLIQYIAILETLFPENILNTIFWFSTIGIVLLWHEYYREYTNPKKLPDLKAFTEHELEQIKNDEIKFGRYSYNSINKYISIETIEFLSEYTKKEIFSPLKMLKALQKDEIVKTVMNRADLLNLRDYINDKVNKSNMPSYPIYALKSLLLYALEEAMASKSRHLEPIHIFFAICKVFPIMNKYLNQNNSSLYILRESLNFEQDIYYKTQDTIFDYNLPYIRTNGIARDWVYGYTYVLNHFSKDINLEVSNNREIYGIGHQQEVDELISVIGRIGKKNALLIGDPGVGKSSLIKGLAQRINKGDVPEQLKNKRIIQLDINGLIAASSKIKKLEYIVQRAIEELNNAGNTILYIDELQELVPTKAAESGHSLASIILPYLSNSSFPIVGTTNYANYKKYFYTNESFRQSFTNIELNEITAQEALDILQTKITILERNFKVYITTPALTSAIELAQRYVHDRMLPDSAVDLLESGCAWAQSTNINRLTDEHISRVTSMQTNIDIESINSTDLDSMNNLAQKIKAKVIGQDVAVESIVETLKRSKTGLRNPNKPIGVFLFIGPTGVGKTHLAKTIAEEFFQNKEDIVRIDMSEYQDTSAINKILGSSSSMYDPTNISLLDRVKTNPYTIILFDEVEKANPQILDLFLQLFDEGRLTSNTGELVNFTNTIIICTSNIGSNIITNEMSNNEYLWEDIKNKVLIELKQAIRPELFNRFDNVVIFEPHTIDTVSKIAELILQDLYKRIRNQNIELKWSNTIPMLIGSKAYDPAMGARPIKRYIQENIEGKIAQEIIDKNIKQGDTIEIKESWII